MQSQSDDSVEVDRESGKPQYREMMVEHIFIADMWKEAWFRREKWLDILRSEVDASGFDLVMECAGVQRHIQLKSSRKGSATKFQKVNTRLETRAGGCVVWVVFDGDRDRGFAGCHYRFYGGGPGTMLSLDGLKVAKHTRANHEGVKGERPAIRKVPKSRFRDVGGAPELFTLLFGDA